MRTVTTRRLAGNSPAATPGELHSLAAKKAYDWQQLREELWEECVRPLIKHREFRPIDHRITAQIDDVPQRPSRTV